VFIFSSLEAGEDELVADFAVVFWQVDDKVCGQIASLSIRLATNVQHGWFTTATIHASGGWRNGEGRIRIRSLKVVGNQNVSVWGSFNESG